MNEEGRLIKLTSNHKIKPFNCKSTELSDFLFNRALNFQKELLATTFIIENNEDTIAYYSLFTDSLYVQEEQFASKTAFKRFLKKIVSHPKRHLDSYPAVKIGRLAVNTKYEKMGIAKGIVSSIIEDAKGLNETFACKLITVDAKVESLAFYKKLNFEFLSSKDEGEPTREMYFDLTPLIAYPSP